MHADASQAGQVLAALRQGFLRQLPVRLAAIEQCWIDCHMEADPVPALRELSRLAHSLNGTARTYGFLSLGAAAGDLEVALRPWTDRLEAPPATARPMLDALVATLAAVARATSTQAALPSPAAEPMPDSGAHALIHVLDPDRAQAQRIATQLEHYAYRARAFSTFEALQSALALERPDLTLIDCDFDLGPRLRQAGMTPPLIFISARDDIETRLHAVQAGGAGFLPKPIDYTRLIEEMDRVTGRMAAMPYRILVVEDDASLARYYRSLLQDAGMEALAVTQPLEVLRAIAAFNPDLVLLDVYLPGCTGVELAHVIRQHGAHAGLPIVFLSAERDLDIQFSALRTGGDDFLTKPVDPTSLIRTLTLRAARSRRLGALMTRDALTGLLNHSRVKEMLSAEVARAKRGNASLAVALIELDDYQAIYDTHGQTAGDQVIKSLALLLRERLRGSDLAGRMSGGTFLLILPDCEQTHASQLVENIRQRFGKIRQFGASLIAGLAVFPVAATPEDLIQAAETALRQAGRSESCNSLDQPRV
jgi:diguanylate cyclase (GGDEF)-like protein